MWMPGGLAWEIEPEDVKPGVIPDTRRRKRVAPATTEEYSAYIRKALSTVDKDLGKVQHLHDALEPVRAEHDDLQVVEHAGEHAYTLVAGPDYLAGSFLCDTRSAKKPYAPGDGQAQQKDYGNKFAFQLL